MPKIPAVFLAWCGASTIGINQTNAVMVASLKPSNEPVRDKPINNCVIPVRYQNKPYVHTKLRNVDGWETAIGFISVVRLCGKLKIHLPVLFLIWAFEGWCLQSMCQLHQHSTKENLEFNLDVYLHGLSWSTSGMNNDRWWFWRTATDGYPYDFCREIEMRGVQPCNFCRLANH